MKLGIIGGVGTVATSIFFEKCLEKITELTHINSDSDFPDFVVSSIPMHNGQSHGVFQPKDVYAYFKKNVETINLNSDDVAVVVCNTIQKTIPRNTVDYPVLDNIALTRKHIHTPKTIVLASEGAIQHDVWGLPTVPNVLQMDVTFLIDEIMKNHRGVDIPKDLNNYLATFTKDTTIVLGCTELSILHYKFAEATRAHVIDSVDVMADELLAQYFTKEYS